MIVSESWGSPAREILDSSALGEAPVPKNASDARQPSKVLAIVSGKGGSGKTMIGAAIATILSEFAPGRTILLDSDVGTGGLTYYFGLSLAPRPGLGLAKLAGAPKERITVEAVETLIQKVKGLEHLRFLGLGDHRRLYRELEQRENIAELLSATVRALRGLANFIVVDCRGGIDAESIAVCQEADDILLVVEPDTTSLQAGQHVVDILSEHNLDSRLIGFVINKVFDDPGTIVRAGSGLFRCRYLASIPFDLDATRAFYIGEIPRLSSNFGIHVWQGLFAAYDDLIPPPFRRSWEFRDFREVGLTNTESVRGGMVYASLLMLLGITFSIRFFLLYPPTVRQNWLVLQLFIYSVAGWLLGLAASLEPTRRLLGRATATYIRILKRVFSKLTKG
ncbi:MAG TPA: P-loop NTPase [Longimicrobium sp.]